MTDPNSMNPSGIDAKSGFAKSALLTNGYVSLCLMLLAAGAGVYGYFADQKHKNDLESAALDVKRAKIDAETAAANLKGETEKNQALQLENASLIDENVKLNHELATTRVAQPAKECQRYVELANDMQKKIDNFAPPTIRIQDDQEAVEKQYREDKAGLSAQLMAYNDEYRRCITQG